jgi:hypothetical protein
LCDHQPFHSTSFPGVSVVPFDIEGLESEALMRPFYGTTSYVKKIRVETVPDRRGNPDDEAHPAALLGLTEQNPTILFIDSLGRERRIEAIAHELAHLLLVYRHGLGVIGRRIPRHGDSEDVFRFFMSMRVDWVYLLGQIANTAHHLILIECLREEYGIESHLHLRLLRHNFRLFSKENNMDKESLYAKGIIAFEYEKLIGKVDRLINLDCQTEFFWKSYHSAQEHFDQYSFHSIPEPSSYRQIILSFLEALGFPKDYFVFFPDPVA